MSTKKSYIKPLLLCLISAPFFILSSCGKSFQDRQINDIPGEWEVFEIITLFIDHTPFKPSIEETGDLGIFKFTKSSVKFSFIRKDTLNTSSGPYSIDRNRVSQKIIFSSKENFMFLPPDSAKHELSFANPNNFIVMELVFYPTGEKPREGYILRLRKVD